MRNRSGIREKKSDEGSVNALYPCVFVYDVSRVLFGDLRVGIVGCCGMC